MSVSPAAARSTSSSSRTSRRTRSTQPARPEHASPHGSVIAHSLPADSPPMAHGEHRPGEGATPVPALKIDQDGSLHGSLGGATADAALVEAAIEALRRGASRTVEIDGRQLFLEVFPVRPRLVIVGATEIARALASIAGDLGYERIVIDARPAFAASERFPDVERLINDWPDVAFDAIGLGPNDAVAILSHDPKFDEPAIADAVRRGARYVGAIGSRKTQADRRARLAEAGLSAERDRLRPRSDRPRPWRQGARRDGARDHGRDHRHAICGLGKPEGQSRGRACRWLSRKEASGRPDQGSDR